MSPSSFSKIGTGTEILSMSPSPFSKLGTGTASVEAVGQLFINLIRRPGCKGEMTKHHLIQTKAFIFKDTDLTVTHDGLILY